MNGTVVNILKVASMLINLIPPPKPFKTDYEPFENAIKEHYDKVFNITGLGSSGVSESQPSTAMVAAPQPDIEITVPRPPVESEESQEPDYGPNGKAISTSCINCSRSHLVTISGMLDEGLRFAREGGIMHPEAIKRLTIADREVNAMERLDLSPESIQNSPPKDQEMARLFLPKIRKLRQDIGNIKTTEDMEKAAAESSVLSQEFRLRQMQSKGVDLNPVMELAKKVQSGEISMEEARERVKQYLPKGE